MNNIITRVKGDFYVEQKWKDKVENEDFVKCLECSYRAATLGRHLKSEHNMTAEDYKNKHGLDVLIRAVKLTEKRQDAAKNRKGGFGKGDTKIISCPTCGINHKVPKFLGHMHEHNCSVCKKNNEENRWINLSEPEDYVTCEECDYKAENLTSHIQNAHPHYRDKYPDAFIVSLNSLVRNKDHWIGKNHSKTTRKKMSENAGKWSLGLTKETDERVADQAEKMIGSIPWNKGQTAETNTSLASTSKKMKQYFEEGKMFLDNGLKANLTLEDFKPFMDSEGRIDHKAIEKHTSLNYVTIRKYILELGLQKTNKYVKERGERDTVRIDKEILKKYSLKNGKISIGRAMAGLKHSYRIIKRECLRHSLKTNGRGIFQSLCLENISLALGNIFYIQEWNGNKKYINPKTNYPFYFDGYFPELGLVVEFHGHQHYTFPNIYMPDESYEQEYLKMRERDRIKEQLIKEDSKLIFFKILEEEPFSDVNYIKGRLKGAGVLNIKPQ